MKQTYRHTPLLLCVSFIAMVTGYFLGDNSSEIHRLKAELDQLKLGHRRFAGNTKPDSSRRSSQPVPKTPAQQQPEDLSNMSEFAIKAGITAKDVEATRELEKQRREGVFILKNERPLFRKLQDQDFKTISAETASANAEAYDRLFADLGLDPKVGSELRTHLAKIHQAALEAETSIVQVTDARRKYDERLRSLLSEEDYSRYFEYELSKPARYELGHIKNFAANQNSSIDPSGEETLVGILLDANAVYGGLGDGPYGSLPHIPANTQEAVLQAELELQHLIESTAKANDRLADSTLQETDRKIVTEYLLEKIEKKRTSVHALQNPKASQVFSPRRMQPPR